MKPGRVEAFIYSIEGYPNIGGCLAKLSCRKKSTQTHQDFIDFCRRVAQIAYMYQTSSWNLLMCFNEEIMIKEEKDYIEKNLDEHIEIEALQPYTFANPKEEHQKHIRFWIRNHF
jgi:hypothetical protein